MSSSKITFISPINGDCLTERDCVRRDNTFYTTVTLSAPAATSVSVNGVACTEVEIGIFSAELPIDKRTVITATLHEGDVSSDEACITVYLLEVAGGYRISVDDNIRCLAEISSGARLGTIKSIFDHPYLAIFKEAHDKYNAYVHLNLFYETDTVTNYKNPPPYFDLYMMTDEFKSEWAENSDWLKLSFHSRREFPAFPYKSSTAEEIGEDYSSIKREIIRFAGEGSFSDVTTVHYGSASKAGLAELKRQGAKTLMGIFELDESGVPSVGYDFPTPLADHISKRDFWYSDRYEMLFGRIDIVLNNHTLDEAMAILEDIYKIPGRAAFLELMIHEQYFYEDYVAHLPSFRDFILKPCEWAASHGYVGMDEITI